MARFVKKYKEKVGRPPGTLIHIGREKTADTRITLFHYDENSIEERTLEDVGQCFPYRDKSGVTWVNIDGVHRTEVIESIGKHFDIHPLVMSDIVNTTQRPKMEDYQDYLFLVLKMVYFGPQEKHLTFEQVSMIVGNNMVISFQENEGDLFEPVRNRIRIGGGRIRKSGPDYLAYALTDTIVDNYFVILERFGEKIEEVEEVLLKSPTEKTMQEIHAMKREMIHLRRSVWPLREVTAALEKGESKIIHRSTRIYLRDIYDHTIQVIDTIESSRDILSGLLDIYLTSVSNRMNSVMKVLTIIATIFMPLTFIAGVYGMNFIFMPELEWRIGYPLVLVIMLVIGLSMLYYFRRKKWL
jgi:magnesium transporter